MKKILIAALLPVVIVSACVQNQSKNNLYNLSGEPRNDSFPGAYELAEKGISYGADKIPEEQDRNIKNVSEKPAKKGSITGSAILGGGGSGGGGGGGSGGGSAPPADNAQATLKSEMGDAVFRQPGNIVNDTAILPEVRLDGTLLEGYMTGHDGDQEYFILGKVNLHKPGAPETEWTDPIFYLEFNNKSSLVGTTSYYYFLEERSDGTLVHLPILRELWGTSDGFELDIVFTKSGEIDALKSSVGIVPEQYKDGRNITQLTWAGEYYKKGNKTELFVPIKDGEGKVTNQDEAGEPVVEEMSVHVLDVCYEEITGRNIYYLIANLDNITYRNLTGLCPVYKIQSISRMPEPQHKLDLIRSEVLAKKKENLEAEKLQQSSPISSNITVPEEGKEYQPANESVTPVEILPPTRELLHITQHYGPMIFQQFRWNSSG